MTHRRPGRGPATTDPDDSGVVAVEFALVIPLLVAILLTIVTVGSLYIDQLHLQQVARDAVRTAVVAPTSACAAATSELAGNNLGAVTCTVTRACPTTGTSSTSTAQVHLTSVQQFSLPLVGDRTVTLNATSTFICPP